MQLQSIVTSKNSSDARETLQEQLRQLIAALSSWNNQLKAELDLQQQFDGLLKAFGRQNRRQRETQQPGAAHGGESPRLVEAIPAPDGESSKSSPRSEFSTKERYFQMWQQYSREVSCSNSAELDFKVGRRAFEAGGQSKKRLP